MAASRFVMDGPGVFRATARRFPAFIEALVGNTFIDTIIPHQASAAALEHLKRAVPDGHSKTVDIFRDYGNQIATSMLIGTSAGVSLGGAVIRW